MRLSTGELLFVGIIITTGIVALCLELYEAIDNVRKKRRTTQPRLENQQPRLVPA